MHNSHNNRCDHCKKWMKEGVQDGGTLEGIVSEGIEFNFCICWRCFDRRGFEREYWDGWVKKQIK